MSPDGESIVTGAGDETLRFWNVFNKTRSTKVQRLFCLITRRFVSGAILYSISLSFSLRLILLPFAHLWCEHCKCILTIEHILCPCTTYEHNRKQYFPHPQLSNILLHSPKRNIFNYLTDIKLLTKL